MKIVLNPEYKFLQQFVQDLPTRFASEGKVIQDKRNTIKVFEYKELEINVKRYRVPIFINRIAYTFFRKSKACRAYNNGGLILRNLSLVSKPSGVVYFITVTISAFNVPFIKR